MFNSDQQNYMESLSRISPEKKCYCGWYMIDDIIPCHNCPPGKTLADRLLVQCSECKNYPSADGKQPIIHIKGCKNNGK